MGEKRTCSSCHSSVVLENSGGVYRTIICHQCNVEMTYDGDVETEYVGHKSSENDYKVVR